MPRDPAAVAKRVDECCGRAWIVVTMGEQRERVGQQRVAGQGQPSLHRKLCGPRVGRVACRRRPLPADHRGSGCSSGSFRSRKQRGAHPPPSRRRSRRSRSARNGRRRLPPAKAPNTESRFPSWTSAATSFCRTGQNCAQARPRPVAHEFAIYP